MAALTLEEYVSEVAGDNVEVREALMAAIGKDPKAAERATGLAMREKDYRGKTQQLSADKKIFDAKLKEYEDNLQAADGQIAKLMDQVAKGTVEASTAKGRLQAIKAKYSLSDDDIPTDSEVNITSRVGKDVTHGENVDIEGRLKKFGDELIEKVGSIVSGVTRDSAAADIMWDDINYEHKELFGKRLTAQDKLNDVREFNKLVQAGELPRGTSFQQFWEQKYDVGAKREEVKDAAKKSQWEKEWNDRETARRSQEALDTVRGPERRTDSLDGGSPLFKKEFARNEDPATQFDERKGERGGERERSKEPPAHEDRRPSLVRSGAERAAEKFVQRRAAGIPMGQKEQKSA